MNGGHIFRIHVLQAMKWTLTAWKKVKAETVVKCFAKIMPSGEAGLEPVAKTADGTEAEQQIRDHLTEIYGEEPAAIPLDLDPVEERNAVHPLSTLDEIVSSVLERAEKAPEQSNTERDSNSQDEEAHPPRTMTINEKLAHVDAVIQLLDEDRYESPKLRKVRHELLQKSRKKQTTLTQFFHKK